MSSGFVSLSPESLQDLFFSREYETTLPDCKKTCVSFYPERSV